MLPLGYDHVAPEQRQHYLTSQWVALLEGRDAASRAREAGGPEESAGSGTGTPVVAPEVVDEQVDEERVGGTGGPAPEEGDEVDGWEML